MYMKYNCNLYGIKGSASMEFMQKADEMRKNGEQVLSLAGGEPDFNTPHKICEAAAEALKLGDTHYAVGKGILPLRVKIAEKMRKENGIECTEEEVILTPGGKFGIYMAIFTLINPGDEVIVFTPSWVSYIPMIEACGGCAVPIELDYHNNYMLEEAEIKKRITDKTKAIIINYPNNPTGRILSWEEAEILVRIVEKYNLFIISDEVYEKIVFDNRTSISIGSFSSIRDKVITVNGFSKAFAMTGWRLGYTVAAREITEMMYKLYVHTITGTSPFIQRAALKAFECEAEVQNMVMEYERRRNFFVKELNKIEGITCRMPEGAFYAWVRFDTDKSSEEVAAMLLAQTGIVGVPGSSYGEENETCMRFSFACTMEVLEEAVRKMKRIQF